MTQFVVTHIFIHEDEQLDTRMPLDKYRSYTNKTAVSFLKTAIFKQVYLEGITLTSLASYVTTSIG